MHEKKVRTTEIHGLSLEAYKSTYRPTPQKKTHTHQSNQQTGGIGL